MASDEGLPDAGQDSRVFAAVFAAAVRTGSATKVGRPLPVVSTGGHRTAELLKMGPEKPPLRPGSCARTLLHLPEQRLSFIV